MGERGVRNAEVEGSNPLPSTMTTSPLFMRCRAQQASQPGLQVTAGDQEYPARGDSEATPCESCRTDLMILQRAHELEAE